MAVICYSGAHLELLFGVRWDQGKIYSPKQDVSVACVRQVQAQVNKHG